MVLFRTSYLWWLEMKRDLEAAAQLEEKLRKADEEAEALREEQRKMEEEKAKIAAAAASQQKQTEEEVGNYCPCLCLLISPQMMLSRGRRRRKLRQGLPKWPGKLKRRRRKLVA